jgi:hypothetical protein
MMLINWWWKSLANQKIRLYKLLVIFSRMFFDHEKSEVFMRIVYIGIAGGMHSGKDTVAGFLATYLGNHRCITRPFAKSLKDACEAVFYPCAPDVAYAAFHTQEGKAAVHLGNERLHRVILQKTGDIFREEFGKDVFVNSMIAAAERKVATLPLSGDDVAFVLVPDARYPEEMGVISQLGFNILVEPSYNGYKKPGGAIGAHSSENSTAYHYVDVLIKNEGSKMDLEKKVQALAIKIGEAYIHQDNSAASLAFLAESRREVKEWLTTLPTPKQKQPRFWEKLLIKLGSL